ncbi:hypothetical protein CO666_05780 [Rhizobium chutanense]|uniref:Uncharacterized protein n=1 Tax=Rhizobium chutanense TaxID=2035448 RepID=A0A2A6JGV7_9HYPH|nr:hypothetical protein CO666_05780 [Rhizobium chutanense]
MPKKNLDVQDFPYQKFSQLLGLLQEQDERGLILSVASFAEESLRRLILAYMRDVKSAKKLIDEFGAPLGTFSSRIATAYALGLINDTRLQILSIFGKFVMNSRIIGQACLLKPPPSRGISPPLATVGVISIVMPNLSLIRCAERCLT